MQLTALIRAPIDNIKLTVPVGLSVGICDGRLVDAVDGDSVGGTVGIADGTTLGLSVGIADGTALGLSVGIAEGVAVDGIAEGVAVDGVGVKKSSPPVGP